ncbi:hypothetical protein G7Z17_g3945 [Cylindrodendrum hubeiense]|uniref:Polyketide synthase n=1 Tax=Cylindrodendrum hubeiense TaxID=595255 RepID=A0A9P5HEV9_9HYPO|nr:hypothetical protein G7Z17_g3945 [Cylindrodendrum hubeiense]
MSPTAEPAFYGIKDRDENTNGSTNGTKNGPGTEDIANSDPVPAINTSTNGVNGVDHKPTVNGKPGEQPRVQEPVAIIGCGMRLPGGVHDAETMWDFLINKREGRCRVPGDRYNIDAFYGPGKTGGVSSEYGYFLDDINIAEADARFWTMSAAEVQDMDPQQRIALEVVYECLQNSGATKCEGKVIGSYWGSFGEDWANMQTKDTLDFGIYRISGYCDFALANRVSYEFGFEGPSMTIRTACSSSLTALHEACLALQSGECESAIVGGTNIILNPHMTISMSTQAILAPDGRCKTFDERADGYSRAEGVVAIHIKKLSDAIRDNDPIRAVIRSSCLNSDGRTSNLLQPSSESHEALFRMGHTLAGIEDLEKTAMIECHGTGTAVGDPLETAAVANVFGKHGIYVGSINPNFGHSEGASGVTSVIKTMLALEKGQIPPNRNFETPNKKIPFEQAKLKVPVEVIPWPHDRAERVGVNSFGIGGSNAHVLIESARCAGVQATPAGSNEGADDHPYLMTFSANSTEALRSVVATHDVYLNEHPEQMHDLSYTLNVRRDHLPHRAYSVISKSSLKEGQSVSPFERGDKKHQVVYVFTGQGAQWARMGSTLLEKNAAFRSKIRDLEAELDKCTPPPDWSLMAEMLKPREESQLNSAEFSQPCCTALQIALVDMLEAWGVVPSAVVGHSSGEIGAAYASGAISAADAIKVAYYRGVAAKTRSKSVLVKGGMAAIGCGCQDVTPYLRPGVVVGCENSPSSVTLSGDEEELVLVIEKIKSEHPSILVRQLRVDCAYHSHHMEAVASHYLAMLGDISAKSPIIPFYSSLSMKKIDGSTPLDASYWARNLTSPVRFSQAISELLKSATNSSARPLFLEVGPHSALAGPLRQILKGEEVSDIAYASTLVRGKDSRSTMLAAAGSLFQHGIHIDFAAMTPKGRTLTDLPTYPWQRSGNYWSESRVSKAWRFREHAHHDILGSQVGEVGGASPTWRNLLRLNDVPWIRDHKIGKDIVFPAAGYVAMTGEAVRQLTGSNDYTVREVSITSALVMHDVADATEIITTLKPARLTNTLDSVWFDFTISSLRNDIWVKHASGQVRAGCDYVEEKTDIKSLQRDVDAAKWYSVMKRVGLNYEGRFRGLKDISASVTQHQAVGRITNQVETNESPYAQHPSTIDSVFQLFSVAASRGLSRQFSSLAVPTFIGELYVKPISGELLAQTDAEAINRGAFYGDAIGVSANEPVLRLKNIRFFHMQEAEDDRGSDPHAAVEMEWRPDINLVDNSLLMRPSTDSSREKLLSYRELADRMALACMVETSIRVRDIEPSEDHWHKYRAWLNKVYSEALEGTYANVSNDKDIAEMSSEDRMKMIEDTFEWVKDTTAWPVVTALYRIVLSCEDLFSGKATGVSLLMDGDVLGGIYDMGRITDVSDLITLASHYKGNLKILEIGAGTGGTTNAILPVLMSSYNERLYFSYTYTDISSGFFVAAKERFKEFDAVEYKVLDITTDPLEQGFQANNYDIIVASNVLHATPWLTETLKNVRKLLAPRGRLLMQELSPSTKWPNFIMGVFPGWWLGDQDGRSDEPYLYPEGSEQRLHDAGFDGIHALHRDSYINANMIAMPKLDENTSRKVTLLYLDSTEGHVRGVHGALQEAGYGVDLCLLGDTPHPDQDVVAVLDVEKRFFHDMSEDEFTKFKSFVAEVHGGILWVTGAAQIKCVDPRYALTLGVARTVRTELGLDIATLELDVFDKTAWGAVAEVLTEFQSRSSVADNDEIKPNLEWAFADGTVHVGRFHWTSINKELDNLGVTGGAMKLNLGTRGLLSSLHWKRYTPPEPVGDAVQVRVHAVGLNFKDVMVSMGIIDEQNIDDDGLGCEGAGVVEKVGPDVKHLSHGDRVLIFSSSVSAFATFVTMPGPMCVRIPESLSFADAATMAVVYGTVIYSLIDKARLERGQTVLIHSACGGVGIAAIHICQMVGAEIFCTVGTETKVQHLMEKFGIPRSRIFSSRDMGFKRDVLSATNGRGVDVVLNSLSGELLHASWRCVAEFGNMIEIGKRDLIGKGTVALDAFEQNRAYLGVDLNSIGTKKPDICVRLLTTVMELYEQGHAKPIHPISHFDAAKVEDAMRFMQKGNHIGKVVISLPDNQEDLEAQPYRPKFQLSGSLSYLLVGGLGGIGQAIAIWMAEAGAKEIVFFSRSATTPDKYDKFVKELECLGCSAVMVSGSVASESDTKRAVNSSSKPLGGVIHMSMVLNDSALPDMSFQDWQTTLAPKVDGTWRLHRALLDEQQNPAFFILFSSVSGLCGQWGQSNYAAANTFLDAFTQYRHSQGLPSATIDVGVVEDVGYVSRNPQVLNHFHAASMHVIYERDLLDSLQVCIDRCHKLHLSQSLPPSTSATDLGRIAYINKAQLALGVRSTQPLAATGNRIIWRRDIRMSIYRNLEQTEKAVSGSGNEQLKKFLADVALNPDLLDGEDAALFLAGEIGKTLFAFMLRDEDLLDISRPMSALGLDSLVAVELKNWFRQTFGLEMTVMQVMESPSLADLGKKTAEMIKVKHVGAGSAEIKGEAPGEEWGERRETVAP